MRPYDSGKQPKKITYLALCQPQKRTAVTFLQCFCQDLALLAVSTTHRNETHDIMAKLNSPIRLYKKM